MKTNSALLVLISLAIPLPAMADKFTLKDGTTLEATVSSETADSYVLEVQITKSIKDERTVAKADVVKVEREQLDLKAFETIAKLLPTPDMLSDEEYGKRINAVQKFINDYPASPKTKDAKAMLATLKAESAQVASGGIKLGTMISPADYQLNAYDLDSRVQEAKIRDLVEQGEILSALRAFSDFSKDFQSTKAFGGLAPLMQQLIKGHVATAKESLLTLEARLKKRATGLEQMSAEDRRNTGNAIKEEDASIEARFKAEKEAKIIWVTPSPFNKASLEETVRVGEAELVRLASIKVVLGQEDGGKAWREAWAIIHKGGSPTAISSAVTAARTAGVSAKYMAMLDEAAKVKK